MYYAQAHHGTGRRHVTESKLLIELRSHVTLCDMTAFGWSTSDGAETDLHVLSPMLLHAWVGNIPVSDANVYLR